MNIKITIALYHSKNQRMQIEYLSDAKIITKRSYIQTCNDISLSCIKSLILTFHCATNEGLCELHYVLWINAHISMYTVCVCVV